MRDRHEKRTVSLDGDGLNSPLGESRGGRCGNSGGEGARGKNGTDSLHGGGLGEELRGASR